MLLLTSLLLLLCVVYSRFIDMHCTYMGSTGAARGSAATADGAGGLDLSPVYVPAYIFSWWHGGAKVRTQQLAVQRHPLTVIHEDAPYSSIFMQSASCQVRRLLYIAQVAHDHGLHVLC